MRENHIQHIQQLSASSFSRRLFTKLRKEFYHLSVNELKRKAMIKYTRSDILQGQALIRGVRGDHNP